MKGSEFYGHGNQVPSPINNGKKTPGSKGATASNNPTTGKEHLSGKGPKTPSDEYVFARKEEKIEGKETTPKQKPFKPNVGDTSKKWKE